MVAIDDPAAAEAKFGSPRQFDDRREWADQVSKCISECSRAAGTNAAVNWRDYGTPAGSSRQSYTTLPCVGKGMARAGDGRRRIFKVTGELRHGVERQMGGWWSERRPDEHRTEAAPCSASIPTVGCAGNDTPA